MFAGGLLLTAALATLLIERPRGEYVENMPMPARVGGH
jgi:hypothetical protein